MTTQQRSILVNDVVVVGEDSFTVTLILSRPHEPVLDRDMETIRSEVGRLLPGWIKPKIQAGEPQ